jgi:hypothetical protein
MMRSHRRREVASGWMRWLNVGAARFLSVDGGVARHDTNLGIGGQNLTVIGHNDAEIDFATSQSLTGITLIDTSRIHLTSSGPQVLRVGNLNLGPDSTIDLATHSMIVQSTAAARAGILANTRSWIRSGRNHGAWNGSGITSSAAADDPTRNTGLAAIVNDRGDGSVVRGELGGMIPDANCILITWTYNGDGDLNGLLNADDYAIIDAAIGGGGATDYSTGDFDYSDTTNSDDYFLIDKAYSGQDAVFRMARRPCPPNRKSQLGTHSAASAIIAAPRWKFAQ